MLIKNHKGFSVKLLSVCILLGLIIQVIMLLFHHRETNQHPEKILFKARTNDSLTQAVVSNHLLKWLPEALEIVLDDTYNKSWSLVYYGGVIKREDVLSQQQTFEHAFSKPFVYANNSVNKQSMAPLDPIYGEFHLVEGPEYVKTYIIPRKYWREDNGDVHLIYANSYYFLVPAEFIMGGS
jgi:hypothetical protein